MKSIFENKWGVMGLATLCTLLWGSAFPVLKIGFSELQIAAGDTSAQIVFAGIRFLLAGLIILGFLLMKNPQQVKVKKEQIPILVVLGISQTAVQYYFFYVGLSKVSGMQGSILNSSGIFLAIILAHFFYQNDKLNWQKSIGILVGFAGIIVANWGQELQFQFHITGEGFMILAGVTTAITTIMTKQLAIGIHPITLTGWQLTIGAIVLLIIGVPQLSQGAIVFTPFGWGLILYAALLSAVAFTLWTAILKYNKAGEISIYNFLTPLFGATLSAFFIPGEKFNLFILAALALVTFGIIIVNYRGKREAVFTKETAVHHGVGK